MPDKKNNTETLNKIVESAITLFNKDGFAGASIGNITTLAGVAKGNLYYYFKSKDELYLYCAKKCIEDIRAYIHENVKKFEYSELSPIYLLKLRINFFEINPNYRVLFLNILNSKPGHLTKELSNIRSEFKDENIKLFMEYFSYIKLGKGVTTTDILTFISVLENYTSLPIETFDNKNDYDDYCKSILRMATIFINGLKNDME